MSNKLDKDYQNLLQCILDNGVDKQDRTGTGTRSLFGAQIRHNMQDGFPLLTTKRMAVKTMMTELKWFLKGDTNIKYLVDNKCNIWNGDAYKKYKQAISEVGLFDNMMSQEEFINKIKTDDEFAKEWGELGPIYGSMWRKFDEDSYGGIDQIQNLIDDLKTNPDSRRLMVTAWHPGYNQHSVLPPCHYGFQVYTRELRLVERIDIAIEKGLTTKNAHMSEEDYWNWCDTKNIPTRAISLMWNQRSCDLFLGIPFNIASYGLLLELIAKEVNMIPDQLIGNLGDVHLYSNHLDQARKQIMREPYNLPVITKLESNLLEGEFDCDISYYECWPAIKAPLSN